MDDHRLLYLLQSLQLKEEETKRVRQCILSNDFATALMLLRSYRIEMLDRLHSSQQALDDLDLLVYQIKKM